MELKNEEEVTGLLTAAYSEECDGGILEKEESSSDTPNKLTTFESFYVMFGFTFGSGILLISNILRELGPVRFFIIFTAVLAISCLCSMMLHKCVLYVINEQKGQIIRDPYQSAAESAGGYILKQFACVMMYIWNLMAALSVLLVGVQLIAVFMPFDFLSANDNIRVWVILVAIVITPIMYLGTYLDLKLPAIVAALTSSISFVLIIINCTLKESFYPTVDTTLQNSRIKPFSESFFISIGSIIFVTGTSMTVANVTAFSEKPEKIVKSIIGSYAFIYIVFMIVAFVSFFTVGNHVAPSIISTFEVIIAQKPQAAEFRAMTIIIQLLMFLHMMMITIITMNPLYLQLEEALGIPFDFNYKRVVARTLCIIFMVLTCLAVPHFEFAVSIAGGVPFTLMGMFLPALMYAKIYDISIYSKLLIYIFLVMVIIFMVGNLVVSFKELVV